VRNTSIDGNQKIAQSLSGIKGVGRRFAQAVLRVAGFDEDMRAGNLSDKDIAKLENVMQNPLQFGIPVWMLNRQKDLRTGDNLHITGTDVDLLLKMDIDRMKRTRSWKGVRHHLNLKVRGQRTRTTGRSGLIVGVVRKKKGQATAQKQKGEAPKEGKKEKKPKAAKGEGGEGGE
jgi:small subunit ribosomal protein S13